MSNKHLLTPKQETLMRKEVKLLRQQNAQQSRTITLLKQRIELMETENKELRSQSRQQKKLTKLLQKEIAILSDQKKTYTGMIFKANVSKNSDLKRGCNTGYTGSSRYNPLEDMIDETITVKHDKCPDCGNNLKLHNKVYEHIVEDIVLPVKKTKVIKYEKCRQYCSNCKKEQVATHHNEIPNSNFGSALSALILMLKYECNLSLPKIQNVLKLLFDIEITTAGIQSQLNVSKRHFEGAYSEILENVRASTVKHADETSWRISGKNAWVWILCNNLESYYHIEGTRGGRVPKKLFGNSTKKETLVRDDYAAYASLNVTHQSCWAHLLRKARDYASFDNPEKRMILLSAELNKIFKELNVFLSTDPPNTQRELEYTNFLDKLDTIINRKYKKDSYADKIRNRIARQYKNLLTAVLVKGVPLTNNLAERDLRPIVINRKISGGSQSALGAEITAVNKSVVQTLNKRKVDLLNGLEMLIGGTPLSVVAPVCTEST